MSWPMVSPLRQRMIDDIRAQTRASFAAQPYPQLQAVRGFPQTLAGDGDGR